MSQDKLNHLTEIANQFEDALSKINANDISILQNNAAFIGAVKGIMSFQPKAYLLPSREEEQNNQFDIPIINKVIKPDNIEKKGMGGLLGGLFGNDEMKEEASTPKKIDTDVYYIPSNHQLHCPSCQYENKAKVFIPKSVN